MGRNFLSATELVHQVISDLKPFTDMLSHQDRLIFNKFYEAVLNNRAAIANAASLLPLEATLLLLLLKEHKDTPQAVRDGLLAIKDYPGISGTITFPGNGEAVKKLFIIKIQDGKFAPYTSGK